MRDYDDYDYDDDAISSLSELVVDAYNRLNDDSCGGYYPNSVKLSRDDVEYYTTGDSDEERIKELYAEFENYYEKGEIKIFAGKKHFRVMVYDEGM